MTPTVDRHLIREIVCHPRVWPGFGGVHDSGIWEVPIHEGVAWLVEKGFVMAFFKHRPEWWEVHVGCLPRERGGSVARALRGFDWMRANTSCRFVNGVVREHNTHARKLAEAVGMRVLSEFAGLTFVGKEL